MSESPRRLAVIDIGSNAVRLHIALLHQAEDDCLTEVFTRVPLALGVDVFGEGDNRIAADTGRRLEKIVDGMKRLIDSMQPLVWQTVATAALRQARNRQATLNRLRKNVGVSVRILSGEEEAALIGCSIGARHPGETVLNIDIGGGSTDCALVRGRQLLEMDSFAVGLTRSGGGEADEKERFSRWLKGAMRRAPRVTASGGSASSLTALFGVLDAASLARRKSQLLRLSPATLSARYGVSPDRCAQLPQTVELYRLILRVCKIVHPVRSGLGEAVMREMLSVSEGSADTGL